MQGMDIMAGKEDKFNRRDFLKTAGTAGLVSIFASGSGFAKLDDAKKGEKTDGGSKTKFSQVPKHKPDKLHRSQEQYCGHHHVCLSADVIEANPNLLTTVRKAGVTDVWTPGFFYGHWPYAVERIRQVMKLIEQSGMGSHVANIPLGHPGDSLGSRDGKMPLIPPIHWKEAILQDGKTCVGTSLHKPATQENQAALRQLWDIGVREVFLDDDFRLARSPGVIGGCFCDEHRQRFLHLHGYGSSRWDELLGDVRDRRFTTLLRKWVDFTCDELTGSFRAQQAAVPSMSLGNMVMYLGSEKAGIRLADYAGVPLRVGEGMFNDATFGPTKGKTNELFSVLFHRRFVEPENAFSETTAFPADSLSAKNVAAKLTIPLLADVRHTMFMSGITPFPISHWDTLGPAIKQQKRLRDKIAGHQPHGPFKHYWGEHSRYVGHDKPYSLFLALGVPFEVVEQPVSDGWTFLSDFDARAAASRLLCSSGSSFVYRPQSGAHLPVGEAVAESLESLFALRRKIIPQLQGVPYVEEETPVVCTWYPSAQAVLLWNLAEDRRQLTVNFSGRRRTVTVDDLGVVLVLQ